MTRYFDLVPGYESLATVYDSAIEQASEGKGKERHANEGEAYENQIICEVARRVGLGYPLGQAVKKIYESQRLIPQLGVQELLGAMNYLAAAVIVMQERMEEEGRRFREGFASSKAEGCEEQAFQVGEHVQYRIAELSEGARWLDAWYLERLPNGRGHIVKSKAEGRIAVDPDKIRKAPWAEGCEEPEFKSGDRVQFRDEIPSTSEPHWFEGVYVERLSDGGHAVAFGQQGHVIHCSDKDIRRVPKAEDCEDLEQEDPPLCGERCEEYTPGQGVCRGCRHAPKEAEGCEELVQKDLHEDCNACLYKVYADEHVDDGDAPQTPAELYDKIIASNPATFGRPRTPTGEELAEMAEEDAHE